MTRIVFADDHNLVREGIIPFLQRLTDDAQVHEASNLDEALSCFPQSEPPDLLLLDLNMPGMDGFNGIAKARGMYPQCKIVVISAHFNERTVRGSLAAGAQGFIPKISTKTAMMDSLRAILAGETVAPTPSSSAEAVGLDLAGRGAKSDDDPWQKLTHRESEALRLLIDGKTNKEIARILGLNEITVKGHMRNAYKKIGAGNRADAVRIALQSRKWMGTGDV